MPTFTSLIIYIVEQNTEAINNYEIQRGIGLSHIPDGEPQRIRFTYFIPKSETRLTKTKNVLNR